MCRPPPYLDVAVRGGLGVAGQREGGPAWDGGDSARVEAGVDYRPGAHRVETSGWYSGHLLGHAVVPVLAVVTVGVAGVAGGRAQVAVGVDVTAGPGAADDGRVAQVDAGSPAVVVQRPPTLVRPHQTARPELLLHLDAADVDVWRGAVVVRGVRTPGLPGWARGSLPAAQGGVAGAAVSTVVPRGHVLY